MSKSSPRLKTVNKSQPAFPLNKFPNTFPYILGREIVYLLAFEGKNTLVGDEWEQIFAKCIGANWKKSNIGLDDVISLNTAWGAKSVILNKPSTKKTVRLISGRNSLTYSYENEIHIDSDVSLIGESILTIWNDRVSGIREKFDHLRTVVLIKSKDMSEVVVFEFETIRYDPELFEWRWNTKKNLEGYNKRTGKHKFTWQPHGAQFTIIEDVPDEKLIIKIKTPSKFDKDKVLKSLGFDNSWITVINGV